MRRKLIPILLALAFVAGALVAPAWLAPSSADRITVNKWTGDPALNGFRLTLTSATPVTTADVTGATTVYYTPYVGNRIVLYDGTNYQLYSSAEVSLALGTIADASNYDIWVLDADSDGDLDLELSAAWTNDTTRSQAIATTNGVVHKSGDQTRRLAGTIRTTATTTTEDSAAKRFLWNASNRVERKLKAVEAADTWTYGTAAWRAANNSTANRVAVVCGGDSIVYLQVAAMVKSSAVGQDPKCGIGVDKTNGSDADLMTTAMVDTANYWITATASYTASPSVGYHYYQWVEHGSAGATITFYGDAGSPTLYQSGIIGIVWN